MTDKARKNLLDDLIDVYIENNIPETKEEVIDVKYLLREKLIWDVSQEIISKEKDKIMDQVDKEVEIKGEIDRRKKIKVLVLETLFLGLLIGLLANQGTDLITFIKGGDINVNQTLGWIIILLLSNIVFGFLVYVDKLNSVLNKK